MVFSESPKIHLTKVALGLTVIARWCTTYYLTSKNLKNSDVEGSTADHEK